MTLQGKGFFTFQIQDCEHGDPAAITAAAKAACLSHVLVKVADGVRPFGLDEDGSEITAPLVHALHAAGIAVWGWHYVYGSNPASEAEIAIQRCKMLKVDGYVVDAEEEYKRPGRENAARQYMRLLRAGLGLPITLCSYRFPDYHPELPWSAFLEYCDYHMPQVYWEQAHNAGGQLRESKRQCDALPHAKPYLATGAAYSTGSGWSVQPQDIIDFLNSARTLEIPAVNFFSWDFCRAHLPGIWKAVSEFPWTVPPQVDLPEEPEPVEPPLPPPPEPPPNPPPLEVDAFTREFLDAMNTRDAAWIAGLYHRTAVHVRGSRIRRGIDAIRADYAGFFTSLPAGAAITLSRYERGGKTRLLTWQAGGLRCRLTLYIQTDKIEFSHLVFESGGRTPRLVPR